MYNIHKYLYVDKKENEDTDFKRYMQREQIYCFLFAFLEKKCEKYSRVHAWSTSHKNFSYKTSI